MTYLVPDDWYANHLMAPGDARLPQKRIEFRGPLFASAGSLVPTPPMRGYFGRRPYTSAARRQLHLTKSPFADTDVMWGVHGLGNDPIAAILDKLKREMKEAALKQAAISTGISIALASIPVFGWAAGAIYAVVQGIVGTKYAKEAQEIIADTQEQAKRIVASYELKLAEAQDTAFKEEQDAGIALALSCTPDVVQLQQEVAQAAQGVQGFSWKKVLNPVEHLRAVTRPVRKIVKKIAPAPLKKVLEKADQDLLRAKKEVDRGIDTISGKEAVIEAERARAKILAQVNATMEEQYQAALANMASPEFRHNLRLHIAEKVLSDQNVAAMVGQRCGLGPAQSADVALPGVDVPSAGGSNIAKGAPFAAAAAVAVMLLFKGH